MANRGSTHKTTRFWFASFVFFTMVVTQKMVVKPGEEETITPELDLRLFTYLDSCPRVRNRGGRRQKQPAKEGALQGAFEGWRKEG